MKRISRKKLEKFGVKHFIARKGCAKYAVDVLPNTNSSLRIYYKFNLLAKILTILLFPINLLITGIGNFSEIKDEFRAIWNIEKEWYTQDTIWSGSNASSIYNALSEWYWSK